MVKQLVMNGQVSKSTWYFKFGVALFIVLFCLFNVFLGFKVNASCDNQLVLAKITSYYETLLHEKEDNIRKKEGVINSKKIEKRNEIIHLLHKQMPADNKDSGIFNSGLRKTLNSEELNPNKKALSIKNIKKYKGLKLDQWFDICIHRTIQDQSWHPLFPHLPQFENRTLQTGDNERIIGSHVRRIYGYLTTTKSAQYDFRLLSRDGAEVMLLDTGMASSEYRGVPDLQKLPVVMNINLNKDTMDYQDVKLKLSEMFSEEKFNIQLKANHLYFIEIVQGGRFFAKYQLQWKLRGEERSKYSMITADHLTFTNELSPLTTFSRIMEKYKRPPLYDYDDIETVRHSFFKTLILPIQARIEQQPSFICQRVDAAPKKISYVYQGYREYTENFLVYPREHFHRTGTREKYITVPTKEALQLAYQTFDSINKLYNNNLQLHHVVHIVMNVNRSFRPHADPKKRLYFVELDVRKNGEETSYRTSHFVRNEPSGLCFMQDYIWKPDVEINIMTPVRNQYVWLKYLVHMLEEVVEKTNENNYRLIIIDNNSTDGDYKELLRKSKLKHLYLNLPIKKFNKVKALNYGLKNIDDDDSIAFVLDLHLQLPLNMFDRIRKLTIQGKTAFSPTLMKLACGEHEQYTELTYSRWLDIGTGMMAMYKSDWSLIGGFNEELFGSKWGGEDWEVIDRIFQNGLYLIHLRMQRFYHVHHSKHGMWDGKRVGHV